MLCVTIVTFIALFVLLVNIVRCLFALGGGTATALGTTADHTP